jgi:radical SAM protein with 4Fe4S-binding SPASM domain
MSPPLRGDESSIGKNDRFSPEDCAYTEARIRLLQRGKENLREYCEAIEQHQPPAEDPLCVDCEGESMRCRAGKSAFWVTWDGRMVPCGMLNGPAELPFEIGFSTAWEHIRERAAALRLAPECATCEAKDYCRTCAAMVYTETGDYTKKPQYRCDLIRAVPHACRTVLKEAEEA